LESIGVEHEAFDLSIEASRAIFSAPGLARLFADARKSLHRQRLAAESDSSRSQLLRYLSNADSYIDSIEAVVGILSGESPDASHLFLQPERLPWGERTSAYLARAEGPIDPAMAASFIIEDLCDFISYALDRDFALARYGESKASSQPAFAEIVKLLASSYIVEAFVRPLARDFLFSRAGTGGETLACVSAPFPGTLVPALAVLQEAKALGMRTAMGGGYVSTELRWISSREFFKTVDYLCFDSGYSALESVLDDISASGNDVPLYRTMRLSPDEGRVSVEGFPPGDAPSYGDSARWDFRPRADEARMRALENGRIAEILPDYAFVRPGRYLRIKDSDNPMHALWSTGTWLKARLAYGCYWAKCAFCDCSLDYIKNYRPAKAAPLFERLRSEALRLGLSGVHFADEAAPVPLLLDFALENAKAGRPLSFWGNGRFEPSITPDRASFLSWAGMLGFSAGIEAASEAGLLLSNKGLALADIINACAALSGEGVLVHAYLIHGLPGRDLAGEAASLEILRQMFAEGILHSAFYHKFVLTRHAPFYERVPSRPVEGDFGLNDLEPLDTAAFDQEAAGIALDTALEAYMAGEGLDRDARSWFGRRLSGTDVRASLVKDVLAKSASSPGHGSAAQPGRAKPRRAVFIGGSIETDGAMATWSHKNELHFLKTDPKTRDALRDLIETARPRSAPLPTPESFSAEIRAMAGIGPDRAPAIEKCLRRGGLLHI
jgi:radical SAM superfamily enzyme YgiQ (UPF0313 family)